MKVGLALPEIYTDITLHFQKIVNSTQKFIIVDTVELTSDEEAELDIDEIIEDDEEKIYHMLHKIKKAHKFKNNDLFIVFFKGKLLAKNSEFPHFLWTNPLDCDNPGVGIISLSYLYKSHGILDDEFDKTLIGKSIESNIMCAITLMATPLDTHYETTCCIMDFCRDMQDINYSLRKGFLFCKQKGCEQKLFKLKIGQSLISIANGLNTKPFKSKIDIPMMPRCFKTDLVECAKVKRVIPNQVFIGMPFRGSFEDAFNYGIKPILDGQGFSYWKADDHPNIIDLMCKVCEGIQESEFAIVNLSEWNPNVFFELGLCYALGRKVLIIKHEESEIPTDLKGMEYLPYSNVTDLRKKLEGLLPQVFI